jgi:hypothetical protein
MRLLKVEFIAPSCPQDHEPWEFESYQIVGLLFLWLRGGDGCTVSDVMVSRELRLHKV